MCPWTARFRRSPQAATRIAESRRIRQVLKQTGGNKTRAAEILQVSYKTLLTKIKDYQLEDKGEALVVMSALA